MAAKILLYDRRTQAQGSRLPTMSPTDIRGGEGRALTDLGQSLERFQQEAEMRREQDGRLYAAKASAEYRARALAARSQAFEKAPDGWRGAVDATQAELATLRDRLSREAGAISPYAQRFVEQDIDTHAPLFLAETQEIERQNREKWQIDTARTAIDSGSAVVATDPREWQSVTARLRETLKGIGNADVRRDLESAVNEALSIAAVGTLAERDPRLVLNSTADGVALEGPFAHLNGQQIRVARNNAQVVLDRRAAQWRASVAESAQGAMQLWDMGLPAPHAPSDDTVLAALGPNRAMAFEAARAISNEHSGLATRPSAELAQIAAGAAPAGNVRDAVVQGARRQAAQRILQQRGEDPMQFQIRNGFVNQQDLIGSFNARQWDNVDRILASRMVSAMENGAYLGLPPKPLTAFEAGQLGATVRALTHQDRGALFQRWSRLGASTSAYRELIQQLFPDSAANLYAGYAYGVPGGDRHAQLALRGEEVLGTPEAQRLIVMPDADTMRTYWRNYVGEAYNGIGGAEGRAYEAFLAHYAGASEAARDKSGVVNRPRVSRSLQAITGGVIDWGGRETLVPLGMSEAQFRARVAGLIAANPRLRDRSAESYNLRPAGRSGYYVYSGDTPEREANGAYVVIRPDASR